MDKFIQKRVTPLNIEQVRQKLAEPNGTEALAAVSEAAFESAWLLFTQEGHASACSFLCRCAKRSKFQTLINEKLVANRSILHRAIENGVPKLRKNAARLAGELGNVDDAASLALALRKEDQRFVRPSQILALGALGGEVAKEVLSGYVVPPAGSENEVRHFNEEQDALQSALKRFVTVLKHEFLGFKTPVEAELRVADGLADSLVYELKGLGIVPLFSSGGAVRVEVSNISAIYSCRSFHEILFCVAKGISPAPKAILHQLQNVLDNVVFTPHGVADNGKIGFRVEVRGAEVGRAELAKSVAGVLENAEPRLLNTVSDYEIEIRIEVKPNGGADVYIKLYTIKDDRFTYRLGALPASIHPATAAAVLLFARKHLKPNARVLDPCCGSGTMLIERGKLFPVESMTGVDIAHKAIDIARQNAAAANSKAKFICNDCLRFSANRQYDEVVANLPFGNRVGTHGNNLRLYAAMLDALPNWLVNNGVAILYTMEFTLLKNLIRERRNLTLLSQARADAGGLMPAIFIVRVVKQ